ncbi:MAG: threonylcarbamoyl-AMP synthase [Candidatus Hydrogenedentes bacterium]|nr:threonylcarbamoyl-AMP synthase [Candidatus Hydrogenedentota bacterium]
MKLLIASNNEGKCREIMAALAGLGVEFVMLRDLPSLPSACEEGASYEENALEKAQHYHALTGLAALADDSGLEVEHLDGGPGVRSARFAGPTSSYAKKNEALLALLKDVPLDKRRARFVCVVVYVDAGGNSYLYRDECKGVIAQSIRGSYGFGYDPLFIPEGLNRTFGELGETIKSQISHRAKALRKARNFFLHHEVENDRHEGTIHPVCKIVRTDPSAPSVDVIAAAAESILAGELIAYPTDTLYGLGANALDAASAARLVDAKRRPVGKPISVIVDSVERARSLTGKLNGVSEQLIDAFWPGPLTIVVEAAGSVPTMLTGSAGKIGVRVPDCLLARAKCKRADVPLTATSANIAGRPPATTAGEIVAAFGNSLSLVLDCGKLSAEAGSTVVDVTSGAVTVIRQGAIAEERIRTVVGENALEN